MMHGTMRSFFILALFLLVRLSNSFWCPDRYIRFSTKHSYCLPPNPKCTVLKTEVSDKDKEIILKFHNQFRSKVAMGNEDRSIGGPLPQAADMMQMEWDDELAKVAQRWTENCHWGHDCNECRAVENFDVGQNLAKTYFGPDTEPDWSVRITRLYDEVTDYHKSWLDSYESHPGPKTGHFTQLIWSRSWRVGCGYTLFKNEEGYIHYYACNYGPAGNALQQPVYKQGQPCSACPTNTQCSTSSGGANTYPGLCKMTDPNTEPAYPLPKGLLFYCAPLNTGSNCAADVKGNGIFNTVRSIGGNYNSIHLIPGRSVTISFTQPIKPKGDSFCMRLIYRKGPVNAEIKDQSSLTLNYKLERGSTSPMELHPTSYSFQHHSINLSWGMKTTFSLTFTVPPGAEQHYLDIRKIIAFDGKCSASKN